jgi:hypothetical protein
MAEKADFQSVFDRLKSILQRYQDPLIITVDDSDRYFLDAPQRTKLEAFAGIHKRKQYVSLYLMPVYTDPSLLDGVSDELKKRMQGKSCFNFRKIDENLMTELAELTERGFANFRAENNL